MNEIIKGNPVDSLSSNHGGGYQKWYEITNRENNLHGRGLYHSEGFLRIWSEVDDEMKVIRFFVNTTDREFDSQSILPFGQLQLDMTNLIDYYLLEKLRDYERRNWILI